MSTRAIQLETIDGYVIRYQLDDSDPDGYTWRQIITTPDGHTMEPKTDDGPLTEDARGVIYQASMHVLGVTQPTPIKETT